VWVSDIAKYYEEAVRVLRPGGLFLVNDYHPIRRMWHESDDPHPRYRYFERGPYEYTTEDGLTQFEYHWTTADHIQAAIDAGCAVFEVIEHCEGAEDEPHAAFIPATLPTYLLIAGRKSPSS
jgi:hypothetical protein